MRIYGGASTFSKMPACYPSGMPKRLLKAVGQQVLDSDGVCYFDTVSSLGSQLISYDKPGSMLPLAYTGEKELADLLAYRIPCIEMVRYGCNGADATEGAIRYARNFTGKINVLSCGYHSCQSSFTFNTHPALGCITGYVYQAGNFEEVINYLYQDVAKELSAVIIEPVMLNIYVHEQLKTIRDMTKKLGIVLIFDEIITGFRFKNYCVANYWDVQPDIILLGKALGGGYPLSIIGGRRDIMDCQVFHSYTFAALPLSVDTAIKVVKIVDDNLDKFWDRSGKFMVDFNKMPYKLKLVGYNTRGVWDGKPEIKYCFWQHMAKMGYLIGPAFFPRIGWSDLDYEHLLAASKSVLSRMESGEIELIGPVPEPLFKRT